RDSADAPLCRCAGEGTRSAAGHLLHQWSRDLHLGRPCPRQQNWGAQMTSLVSLLNEIRQLAPVGSPLYAFRHTDEHHAELVRIVRDELQRGHRDRHLAAGFCLAASRILSSELKRGEWSWRPVT